MAVEFLRPWFLLLIPAGLMGLFLLARRGRGIKRRLALTLRAGMIVTTALALALPMVVFISNDTRIWVLADVSDSTTGVRSEMETALQTALGGADPDIEVGTIAFGRDAQVAKVPSTDRKIADFTTGPKGDDSRLSEALALANSLTDASGRIAVLSDGLTDSVTRQADLLAARGIPVDVMKFSGKSDEDAQLTALSVPSMLREGQAFSIEATVHATSGTSARLLLYANGKQAASRSVTLRKGENNFTFQDVANAAGLVTYEARLIADGDEETRNNRQAAYVSVKGRAGVLIAEGRSGEGTELEKMLRAASFEVTVIPGSGLPDSAEVLRKYDAVVLANVDADSLNENQIAGLREAVFSFGRGLVVTGGDQSYALGGYRGSSLEEMLPVTMDVKGKLTMPNLALVLVIDKSGSMTEEQFGITRLELAKEAAMRACEVLTPEDFVGVIAFDDTAKWAVPLQKVENVETIEDMIGTIRPGGGTAYSGALSEAYAALSQAEAAQKHVIFLSDGAPGDGGFEGYVASMASEEITLTSVAVGSGADAKVMANLAEIGGGRFYAAGAFDNLPKIFTKETYMVAGRYLQNRAFTPVITAQSEMTDFEGFPALTGYLSTTARSLATVSLVSDTDDPILADWRYGAGRVLAWTSDASGAWTDAFLSWDDAAAFFGGLVSHVLSENQDRGVLSASVQDGSLALRYEADSGDAPSGVRADVLTPEGDTERVSLRETMPGVYEGTLEAEEQGAYAVTVRSESDEGYLTEGGAISVWPEEYDLRLRDDEGVLEALAEKTGGRVITDARSLLSQRGTPTAQRLGIATPLILLTLVIFLLDVTLFRFGLERATQSTAARKKTASAPKRPIGAQKPAKAAGSAGAAAQLLAAKKTRKKL